MTSPMRSSGWVTGWATAWPCALAATHAEWLPTEQNATLTRGTAYRASIGPSIMIKGLTASSQIGIYTDGRATLQEVSTFVSLNGGLTEVRTPVTVTLEKTFAFGGEPLIPRRRDAARAAHIGPGFGA